MMANLSKVRSRRKRAKGDICRLMISPKLVETSSEPLNLCVRDESNICPVPVEEAEVAITVAETSSVPDVMEVTSLRQNPRRRKKRSAIFLPPEKLADNDVCICKFKFVSGNQPRLQEKKILSVDSGGNFRFFPELMSLDSSSSQQQVATPLASKPLPDLLPIQPTVVQHSKGWVNSPASASAGTSSSSSSNTNKKLSRRQKMEQTFGEKGFLIQTQHVPATEGSAFCKFRQLKKFTRYLYRSWRHYLPPQDEDSQIISPQTQE
nr:EOG090X02D0 [Eurycercus lamellatus]